MWSCLTDGLNDELCSSSSSFSPPAKKRRQMESQSFVDELRYFNSQREAIDVLIEMEKVSSDVRIFTKEDKEKGNGCRVYIVSSLSRFWKEYCESEEKHHYELIPDHHNCRLFFDLEYSKETNNRVNEEICLSHFLDCVIVSTREHFQIELHRDTSFLLLDSSTNNKFSMHVTVHSPNGHLFTSCTSIRPFAEKLRQKLLEDPPYHLLNPSADKETVLFDLSVYSRNRNMRLFLSSKLEKKTPLIRSKQCKFYGTSSPSCHTIFVDSLIVPPDRNNCQLFIMNENIPSSYNQLGNTSRKDLDGSLLSCSGPSPWPFVDDFIVSILRKWKQEEFIKKWTVSNDTMGRAERVTFYPGVGRYCQNIGREHKSNGTFWIVDLKRCTFTQRCFDVECKGSKLNQYPLPSLISSHLTISLPYLHTELEEEDKEELTTTEDSWIYDRWENVFDS